MQKRIPEEKLGRVTSLFVTLSTLASPLGLLVAGIGAERVGLTTWFVITGILLCLAIAATSLSKNIRTLDAPTK
jgi:DHA3 family macrolide efflux protein-like MFS transporter